ncbi:type II toxin-antitoxin system VapC family toxin [Methylophilus sp. 5]|uniref:type II toxin-antitoxin system VapC family toxin n=1 Tax=Methylophilus sp. 5 TaxID=1112274 RepID=UPI0004BAA1D9|nr:type II toxin-antitoxin system VapC family toxin [Methylophilus sp. 5]
MIILDTNIVSETMRPQPNAQVMQWLNAQVAETLFLTSITLAEIHFGIAALPDGKRKQALSTVADGIQQLFKDRILPFDLAAAQAYASLANQARQHGKGFPVPDGYIAAIAVANHHIIATRDTAPFLAVGLQVVNPWQDYAMNNGPATELRLQQTSS